MIKADVGPVWLVKHIIRAYKLNHWMPYMANRECRIIISRGRNKGQVCGATDSRCRHTYKICENCKVAYMTIQTFNNHKKDCLKHEILTDLPAPPGSVDTQSASPSEPLPQITALQRENEALRNEIMRLRGAIGQVGSKDMLKE